ncbi:hypothetical protein BJ165DRAFT_1464279 [Panaeolus papilionaceus]|nr:hypothetical protein BJ165DRAFT_1464279 [Panaeolus papilionaceus]
MCFQSFMREAWFYLTFLYLSFIACCCTRVHALSDFTFSCPSKSPRPTLPIRLNRRAWAHMTLPFCSRAGTALKIPGGRCVPILVAASLVTEGSAHDVRENLLRESKEGGRSNIIH